MQDLPFGDASFDTVVATCVFCSVADPVVGLGEVARVVRPNGPVLLLEHMRPRNRILGWLTDLVSPVVSWALGPQVNRRTEASVAAAGFELVEVQRWGVWREMVARPSSPSGSSSPNEASSPTPESADLPSASSELDAEKRRRRR